MIAGNKKAAGLSSGDMHLTRFLSLCGVASRRKCVEMIRGGRARVGESVVTEPGFRVGPVDKVFLDGKRLEIPRSPKIYVMLNKPAGYVCSSAEKFSDKLAVDLVRIPGVRLFSAGRLDKDSEGLIIFSNDGAYVEKLTHPRYGIAKKYEVGVDKEMARSQIGLMLKGVACGDEILKATKVEKISLKRYLFVMNEGRKREIRRLVAHSGAKVISLKRVAQGRLELGDLRPGCWRYLSEKEIAASLHANIQ